MPLVGHELTAEIDVIGFLAKRRAESLSAKQDIETKTGLSFSVHLSDRRKAYYLFDVVREWVLENCRDILDSFPYAEAKVERSEIIRVATANVYFYMLESEFGEDRAWAVRNLTYSTPELRAEFHATGEQTSTRDFSYLLDLI
jgi:hypothetical protein